MLRTFRVSLVLLALTLFALGSLSCTSTTERPAGTVAPPLSAVAGVHAPTATPTPLSTATATATPAASALPVESLLERAFADVNAFWERAFPNSTVSYEPPIDLTPYDHPVRTACGRAMPDNAFFCPADGRLYYDRAFMERELETVGDFGPVFIIAHEWGHVVQQELGLLWGDAPAIRLELQADCLAGAYSEDAKGRGVVAEQDLQEATASLTQAGDPVGTPWYDPRAHGSAEQRVGAFHEGLSGGVSACLDVAAFQSQR